MSSECTLRPLPHQREDWDRIVAILSSTRPKTGGELVELLENVAQGAIEAPTTLVDVVLNDGSFFDVTLPFIMEVAQDIAAEFPDGLPVQRSGEEGMLALTHGQVAALLANAFLGTFPLCELRRFSFEILFAGCSGDAMPRAIVHYFHRVARSMPGGVLTFERLVLTEDIDWAACALPLSDLVVDRVGRIEDEGIHMLQVDFANRAIGGGVLRGGRVQEEIRFGLTNPELLASIAFCETMEDREAILMTGAERFSNYTGYSRSLQWAGDHEDQCPRDGDGSPLTQIVAIDALMFALDRQWSEEGIIRELNKAYVGFRGGRVPVPDRIATGNWGCGAFGGNHQMKAMVQWMAASLAGRSLTYFTFGDVRIDGLADMCSLIQERALTVGELYRRCVAFGKSVLEHELGPDDDLFAYLAEPVRPPQLPQTCAVL